MARLARTAQGTAIALVLALVVARPAAAARPTKTVIELPPVVHYPAGTGCDFAVTVHRTPHSQRTIWDFSDGTEIIANKEIDRTITNDATGATFVRSSIYLEVDRYEGALIRGSIQGQFIWQYYPGDVGPDGVVLHRLLALFMVGRAT